MNIVFLNGDYVSAQKAKVSVLDRGFLFGDGVYEVIPVYGGRLFRFEQHLDRLERSLHEIRLTIAYTRHQWQKILQRLVDENQLQNCSVYLQITRGAAPVRDHAFPAKVTPTIFAMVSPLPMATGIPTGAGIKAITVSDIRWKRCDIKAITLLANCLMKQQATEAGADDAIIIYGDEAIEGTASNLFVVKGDEIATPPKDERILAGITRDLIVELCEQHGWRCSERPIAANELQCADEIWLTSSTREIRPVVELDGHSVGSGSPGEYWSKVLDALQLYKQLLAQAGDKT